MKKKENPKQEAERIERETAYEEENRCGKPHNNGEGEGSCLECQIIKLNI